MSESTEAAPAAKKSAAGHGAHAEHEHPNENEYPFVAHHFDSPKQQLEAGKLGIWLFLVTEILFFAGLFCAYTIYRARYPEVFYWAHFFLDTRLGALNTIVLILSSLTAAWAVRNAQLGQQKQLLVNIVITIACACTFMVVKYFEYSHKAHAGLLPGAHFAPHEELWENERFKAKHPESAEAIERVLTDLAAHRAKIKAAEAAQKAAALAAPAAAPAPAPEVPAPEVPAPEGEQGAVAQAAPSDSGVVPPKEKPLADAAAPGAQKRDLVKGERAAKEPSLKAGAAAEKAAAEAEPTAAPPTEGSAEKLAAADAGREAGPDAAGGEVAPGTAPASAPAPAVPVVTAPAVPMPVSEDVFLANALRNLSEKELRPLVDAGIVKTHPGKGNQLERPTRAHMFFSVYFFMTGLHGLHVLIGIGVWVWLLLRAMKGQFGPEYFGPIDFAALYWHLVDLIWIYLFPLLYLIH